MKLTTGRNSTSVPLLEKRREFAVELSRSGMSHATVLKKVNELDATYKWGQVTLRTLQRDIASYYREQSATSYGDIDQARFLRENHVAVMEGTTEMMRLEIAQKDKNDNWKSGERAHALKILYGMQKDFAEIQGWNIGKVNNANALGIMPIQPPSQFDVYDRASVELIKDPTLGQRMSKILELVWAEAQKEEAEELASVATAAEPKPE